MLETSYHMRDDETTILVSTHSGRLDSHMFFPGEPPFFGLLQQGGFILDNKRPEKPISS